LEFSTIRHDANPQLNGGSILFLKYLRGSRVKVLVKRDINSISSDDYVSDLTCWWVEHIRYWKYTTYSSTNLPLALELLLHIV